MRIAYICADPGVPVFGSKGSSVHVQEVTRAMIRRGAELTLFANRFDGTCPPDLGGIDCQPLPKPPKGDPARREQQALAANADLQIALHEHGPFDLIYERYSIWSYAGMETARQSGVPGVLEVNAPLIEEQARHRDLADMCGARAVAERVFQAASLVCAVSAQVADYVERVPGTTGKVIITPNGVNPDRFPADVKPALKREPDTFTVGFVGTLKAWHGLPLLIETFDRLHRDDAGVRLLIVGDGDNRTTVEAELVARGLDRAAQLTGMVPPAEVPAYLASMDVGVAPYPDLPDFYFSPLKLFEYMAAGLPVVASDIGQMSSVIEHGVTGMLCRPGDIDNLAATIAMIRDDREHASALGRAARERILRDQTWDGIVDRVLDIAAVVRS